MTNESLYDKETLLLKISQGNEGAFNILFGLYRNHLFTYLFTITKSTETSEEIVLDVFLKIWHGRDSITEIDNFDAFLYRVAHNKAIDFLRSLQRNPILQQQVWQQMQEPLSEEMADRNLLLKNTESVIREAVYNLTPQRQKVFHLHHNHGFSNEEIANHLQLSKNTVRNHLAASIEFIRKFLSGNLDVIILFFFFKK